MQVVAPEHRPIALFGPGDPRVTDWYLMEGPRGALLILGAYLAFVLKIGPNFMAARKPMELRVPIMLYNTFVVVLSAWLFVKSLANSYFDTADRRYSIFCQGVDYSEREMPRLRIAYIYMWIKVIELLDTVFFVLRKKNNQVSRFHVTHHSLAFITTWFVVYNGVMGQSALFLLNTAVHTLMYAYYALAALPASIRPNLWWKNYVTIIQIVQLFVLTLHMSVPLFYDCGYPKSVALILLSSYMLFVFWFCEFFYKEYILKPKQRKNLNNNKTIIKNGKAADVIREEVQEDQQRSVKNGKND